MTFEPISLKHQLVISPAWKKLCIDYDLHFAEYSFANAYLFRRKHEYQVVNGETPCIKGKFKNDNYYFIPSVPPLQIKTKLPDCLEGNIYCFFPLPDAWINDLKELNMSFSSCRADSDYLFIFQSFKLYPDERLVVGVICCISWKEIRKWNRAKLNKMKLKRLFTYLNNGICNRSFLKNPLIMRRVRRLWN